MWGSYVWNMFDFGSAVRNEGGTRGRNNKGLVTFDRKIKKDAFYLYKAYWSDEKFFHLVGERYNLRKIGEQSFRVYSNCDKVVMKVNGKQKTVTADKVFVFDGFEIKEGENKVVVTADGMKETYTFTGVTEYPKDYSLPEGSASMVRNWFLDKEEGSDDCYSLDDKVGDILKSDEITSMVGGFAGKLIKSPLMLAVKPFTLRQLLSVAKINPEIEELVEQYITTVHKK